MYAIRSYYEDLVLGEEAGEKGHPGDGDGGDQEGPVGDRHLLGHAAHVAHVLRVVVQVAVMQGVVHPVDDRVV